MDPAEFIGHMAAVARAYGRTVEEVHARLSRPKEPIVPRPRTGTTGLDTLVAILREHGNARMLSDLTKDWEAAGLHHKSLSSRISDLTKRNLGAREEVRNDKGAKEDELIRLLEVRP